LETVPYLYTHLFFLVFFCDIIFIGFSFDDEKEKLCVLVEGKKREKIYQQQLAHTASMLASVNFDVVTRTTEASGGKKAPFAKKSTLNSFFLVVILLSFLSVFD
jgi:hypothetical protein